MASTPNILFLYTELAAYTIACFNEAIEHGVQLSVVRWPINREAPFQFNVDPTIKIYDRKDYSDDSLLQLVGQIKPDVILTSGWIDKGYLKVSEQYCKKIPVVLLLDNPWEGRIKQRLASFLGRFKFKNTFTHCWVPGEKQKLYAEHLGFSTNKISTGFYSADLEYFNQIHLATIAAKTASFPKRFLFVGRYLEFKGIIELWQAFKEFKAESNSEWELWCVGTGEMYSERMESDGIKHFGFIQPTDLKEIIAQTGVFILPSRKEPWGVVMHEYAASGFPIVCSSSVGAAEAFLASGKNGYSFSSGSVNEIKLAMSKMAEKSQDELISMAKYSHELAQQISPEKWTQTLLNIFSK